MRKGGGRGGLRSIGVDNKTSDGMEAIAQQLKAINGKIDGMQQSMEKTIEEKIEGMNSSLEKHLNSQINRLRRSEIQENMECEIGQLRTRIKKKKSCVHSTKIKPPKFNPEGFHHGFGVAVQGWRNRFVEGADPTVGRNAV